MVKFEKKNSKKVRMVQCTCIMYKFYAHGISVSIALLATIVQASRLARPFAACIHQVWVLVKTQKKIQTYIPSGYVSMGV